MPLSKDTMATIVSSDLRPLILKKDFIKASFSESDSDKFLSVFLIKDAMSGFFIFTGPVLHHGVQLEKGMNQGRNPCRDTQPVYSYQE